MLTRVISFIIKSFRKHNQNPQERPPEDHQNLQTDLCMEMLTWPSSIVTGFTCQRQVHIEDSESSGKNHKET